MVERLLAKEKVESSNLFARFINNRQALRLPVLFMATWPSGKAEVCKTSITGSNPVVAFENNKPLPWCKGFFVPNFIGDYDGIFGFPTIN